MRRKKWTGVLVVLIFTTDITDWTDSCPICEQDKNQINPLERMVTFCKEGGGMLSVWVLRARSYKTKAEA